MLCGDVQSGDWKISHIEGEDSIYPEALKKPLLRKGNSFARISPQFFVVALTIAAFVTAIARPNPSEQ